MLKKEYIEKHGIILRKVTAEDRKAARTDYQRTADYIISDGTTEFFSTKGNLKDIMYFVKSAKAQIRLQVIQTLYSLIM